MKKLALMALLATVMVAPFGSTTATGTHVSDTPECCQKKESCCPGASCCPSGSHGMRTRCALHAAAR
jgi:hypothetical protein